MFTRVLHNTHVYERVIHKGFQWVLFVATLPTDVSLVGTGWGRRDKNSCYCAITPAVIINSNNMRIIPTARALNTNENAIWMPFFSALL